MATTLTHRAFSTPASASGGNVLAQLLAKARPLVMGVLNVTPDSFSDGGRFLDPQAAIVHARRLAAEGADILDVGAESTRPYGGAVRISLEEERARLAPVLSEVIALGVPVSIDTLKAAIAAWALDLGAAIVNDVWGLQRDPDMARVVAEHEAPVIIMHNRDTADPAIDIVADVTDFFRALARHRGARRHRARADRPRSRHRLRQDAGAEFDLHRPARRMARLRRAAPGRRFAQALYPFGCARPIPWSASADRWPRIFWRSRTAPRSSAYTMWRRRCRR